VITGTLSGAATVIESACESTAAAFRTDWPRLLASELWGGRYDRPADVDRPIMGVQGQSVGGRCLITEAIRLAGVVPNSLHLLAEGPLGHLPSSCRPAQHPARAVGARTQSLFAASPLNVEAQTAH
jgi:hypothetical protein